MAPRWPAWLHAILRRRTAERELDEELRDHLERETEALVRTGLSDVEARRRAHAAFGGLEAIREECREVRGAAALESVLQDARYALRGMWRSPGFTAVAALTLALSLGAAGAVLSMAYAFFLRPLPVPNGRELVEVAATRNDGRDLGFVSYADYTHFRDSAATIDDLAAIYPSAPLFVTGRDRARQVNGAVVSASFFPLLGIEPAMGRFFRPDEDAVPDRDRVVVIADELWRTWFGAAHDVLGSSIVINGVAHTVVGVAPPTFRGLGTAPAQIYLPTMMAHVGYRWCAVLEDADCTILRMIGRLADDVGLDAAAAELPTLVPARWRTAEPGDNSGVSVAPVRGASQGADNVRFLILMACVVGVLLAVCVANLAGLLAARGRTRTHELAVRASIGASRGRLVRQLLTESLILSLVGGIASVWVSMAFTTAIGAAFFATDGAGRPMHLDLGLAPAVTLTLFVITVLVGLAFGTGPALMTGLRADSGLRLRAAPSAAARGAARTLMGAQAAAAVALVSIAALLTSSANHLVGGVNFEPEGVALIRLRPRLIEYTPQQARSFLRDVLRRLEASPGVDSVTMVGTGVALAGSTARVSTGEDRPTIESGYLEIGPRYFETLRTPLLSGRDFVAADDASAPPVAIVSAALAATLWPGRSPIGESVEIEGETHAVVGLVADVPLQSRAEPPRPYAYAPYWQSPDRVDARLQIRVAGDAGEALPSLASAIHDVDPNVPVTETITLAGRLAGRFRTVRMSVATVGYAGAVAVALSAIGLYATLAAAVARRRREIGIRQAIGASSRGILRMVAAEGMAVVAAGTLAGFAIAYGSTRIARHLLYGPAAGDAAAYVLAGALVGAVGLVATWIPARRAARIEPMEALRLG